MTDVCIHSQKPPVGRNGRSWRRAVPRWDPIPRLLIRFAPVLIVLWNPVQAASTVA